MVASRVGNVRSNRKQKIVGLLFSTIVTVVVVVVTFLFSLHNKTVDSFSDNNHFLYHSLRQQPVVIQAPSFVRTSPFFPTFSNNIQRSLSQQQKKSCSVFCLHVTTTTTSENNNDTQEGSTTTTTATSVNEFSFFDEAFLYVRAGSGGQGSATFKKGGSTGQNGLPDGGNGGDGGDVILEVDPSLNTLVGLTNAWKPNSFGGSGAALSNAMNKIGQSTTRPKSFRAENGGDGDRQFKTGRRGKDVIIRVPSGTVVSEVVRDENGNVIDTIEIICLETTNRETDPSEAAAASSVVVDGSTRLNVANGGNGGVGTGAIARHKVKRSRLPPTGGERKLLKLTLKIVADVCLVGVPNAGKSTFLASVTRAKPKIADYPFTTIIPNLGVWVPTDDKNNNNYQGKYDNNNQQQQQSFDKGAGSEGLILCDVPGLIAGAARGVGLGHAFLRHVERCHVIVHLIDATSNDPVGDYLMVNEEIMKYGSDFKLTTIPQVVVVNKIDAFDEEQLCDDGSSTTTSNVSKIELENKLQTIMPHSRLMWMSAKNKDGVEELMTRLASFVKKVKDENNNNNPGGE